MNKVYPDARAALAVELPFFLALGDVGAHPGAGEESGNARAAGADALGKRALRIELDLELAREILLGEQLVLAHVGRDHLLDLLGFEQKAQARAVVCELRNRRTLATY